MIKLNTWFFIISASVLSVTHYLALELALYWQFSWFDIPIHALGGAVVALGVFVLYDFSVPLPRRWLRIVPVICFVFIIALIWEYYEVLIGIPIEPDHELDTTMDLLLGLLGGVVGYFVGTSLIKLQS